MYLFFAKNARVGKKALALNLKRLLAMLLFISFVASSAALFFHRHEKSHTPLTGCVTSSVQARPCPKTPLEASIFHLKGLQSFLITTPSALGIFLAAVVALAITWCGKLFKNLPYDPIKLLIRHSAIIFREKRKKRTGVRTVFSSTVRQMAWISLRAPRSPACV